jgi:Tfp pilus assembly protein PilN
MAAMTQPWLRTLVRFGTGAGIVVGEKDLTAHLARVRPGGTRLMAALRIANFRERPAAEWGAEYSAWLKTNQAKHLAALVVLPRHEVIVRQVQLPGVADQDAEAAIRFQLDGLHPFPEGEVVHAFQRAERTETFVVAIAQRPVIDLYTALFAEAGIPLAGLTFSGGAVFPSLRLFEAPPADGLMAVPGLAAGLGECYELYGESPSCRLFSAEFEVPLERATALAAAEMRLAPGAEPRDLMELLPKWAMAPEDTDFSEAGVSRLALPWAAALAAACPRLGTPVNLLPLELRTLSSRAAYVPTIILGVILVLLTGALLLRRSWMEQRYSGLLAGEQQRLEPRAKQVALLDKQIADASERMQLLDGYRKQTKTNLDIVLELTQTLPAPAWVMSLQIDPKQVIIAGETEQADSLLKKLDASPRLAGSEFTTALARTSSGEIFRIKANREGAAQ